MTQLSSQCTGRGQKGCVRKNVQSPGYDVPYNYNDCKPQDSVGEMSIILRVVLRWKSIFSGHVPTHLPVPIRRRVLGLTSMISKAFKIRGKRNRAMVVQTNGASCDRDVFCIKCVVY
jgi:hypothetical protein